MYLHHSKYHQRCPTHKLLLPHSPPPCCCCLPCFCCFCCFCFFAAGACCCCWSAAAATSTSAVACTQVLLPRLVPLLPQGCAGRPLRCRRLALPMQRGRLLVLHRAACCNTAAGCCNVRVWWWPPTRARRMLPREAAPKPVAIDLRAFHVLKRPSGANSTHATTDATGQILRCYCCLCKRTEPTRAPSRRMELCVEHER